MNNHEKHNKSQHPNSYPDCYFFIHNSFHLTELNNYHSVIAKSVCDEATSRNIGHICCKAVATSPKKPEKLKTMKTQQNETTLPHFCGKTQ